MRSLLQQFHCEDCGNVNWLVEDEHSESAEDYCVQCTEKTTHLKANSRGR